MAALAQATQIRLRDVEGALCILDSRPSRSFSVFSVRGNWRALYTRSRNGLFASGGQSLSVPLPRHGPSWPVTRSG